MSALERVEECSRSTLYVRDGALVRHYHDTGRWSAPFPPNVDASGHARCSGNRRVDLLVERDRTYAGTQGQQQHARVPAHVHNALRVLCRRTRDGARVDVATFARDLAVRTATAWSYACRVVQTWPRAHEEASRLVHPEILHAVRACEDRSGTLRELLERVRRELVQAREVNDLFAHVRLARLCVEASEKNVPVR